MVVDHWNGYGSTPPDNKLWFNSGQRAFFFCFLFCCASSVRRFHSACGLCHAKLHPSNTKNTFANKSCANGFQECVSQVGQEPGILLRGCLSPSLTLSLRAFVDMHREKRRLHFVSSLTRLS
jgi:hypothetical protein